MTNSLQGGCLCGKVRFKALRPPIRTLACHCTFCQKMTGSAFYPNSTYDFDAVEFNEGELRQYAHTSDTSGKQVYVHFCPECGTTVGLTFERFPEFRSISRGCYDDPSTVEIDAHIWARSAQSGMQIPTEAVCFAQARPRPS